ncbi:MAG: transposase [Proteobacteria bacterium]|nr:transposase [Pseudomonadota bacterium]MBU1581580.1 transposase [Pseudomonadota bacterium]MBU2452695.1 transposase [Pseudomonadota bacterium]
MGYPIQLKEAVLKKVLQGNKPHYEVARELGVGRSTIGKWLKEHKQNGNIKLKSKEKRPKDWTAEERISAIIETGGMTEEGRTTWCRKKGIFTHNLDQWKKDAISAVIQKPNKDQLEEHRNLKKEIFALKKDLSRKDKALAETAALLILKKKAQEIWGEPEED